MKPFWTLSVLALTLISNFAFAEEAEMEPEKPFIEPKEYTVFSCNPIIRKLDVSVTQLKDGNREVEIPVTAKELKHKKVELEFENSDFSYEALLRDNFVMISLLDKKSKVQSQSMSYFKADANGNIPDDLSLSTELTIDGIVSDPKVFSISLECGLELKTEYAFLKKTRPGFSIPEFVLKSAESNRRDMNSGISRLTAIAIQYADGLQEQVIPLAAKEIDKEKLNALIKPDILGAVDAGDRFLIVGYSADDFQVSGKVAIRLIKVQASGQASLLGDIGEWYPIEDVAGYSKSMKSARYAMNTPHGYKSVLKYWHQGLNGELPYSDLPSYFVGKDVLQFLNPHP